MTLPQKCPLLPDPTLTARTRALGDMLRKSALPRKPTNHRIAANWRDGPKPAVVVTYAVADRKNWMLASQRALFDIPDDVCFLNAASYSPLPLATVEAGRKA